MPVHRVVRGQKVDAAKVERAKELRRKMTEAEKILWKQLRTNRLRGYHFRRQQVIHGFIADFYCHAAALIIEVDGEIHKQQAEYDEVRDRILSGHGFRVLRFTNDEINRDRGGVLKRIAEECEKGITASNMPRSSSPSR